MRKRNTPSERDLNPESIRLRTELFTKLIVPHKRLIYSICIQYTHNLNEIEDNYHEVLINFYRYIESYNPKRPLKSWIYAVAQRNMWEIIKRRRTPYMSEYFNVETLLDTLAEGEVSCNCMNLDNYRQYYNDDILSAIDALPEIHKEALLLQQAGYSLDEIVEISYQNGNLKSKSADTIKSRIFLAKKQLRKTLTMDGYAKTE